MTIKTHIKRTTAAGSIAIALLIPLYILVSLALSGGPAMTIVAPAGQMCGDGIIQGEEQCDDGNLLIQDGCTGCMIEALFACVGQPSICSPMNAHGDPAAVCGDGVISPGEECDDGNPMPGDGCSAYCVPEEHYECEGMPSVCEEKVGCGDGKIDDGEECDDGNENDDDGCSATCALEESYTCEGQPSECTADASSSSEDANESDDTGEIASSSASSQPSKASSIASTSSATPVSSQANRPSLRQLREDGAANRQLHNETVWQPSSLDRLRCGDGLVTDAEKCDDGNEKGGDGCSAKCAVESGFRCAGEPSDCARSCGDGMVTDSEKCDDGNVTNKDGCSSSCQIETGYHCEGRPSSCYTVEP